MPYIKKITFAFAVILSIAATPSMAWAQVNTSAVEDPGSLTKWAIAAGLGILICVTGFINAKRSHLN